MATILIISGSPGPEAPTGVLVARTAAILDTLGHEVHVLAVRDLPTIALLSADLLDPAIRHAAELVDRADGVVVASAVYRAAYSGLVQSLLNLLDTWTLADKAVLPLANGGTQGHLVAIDYALHPILTARGATRIVSGHFVPDAEIQPGRLSAPAAAGLDRVVRRFAATVADQPVRLAR